MAQQQVPGPLDPEAHIALFSGPYNLPDGRVPRVGGVPRFPWDEAVARQRLATVAERIGLPLTGDEVLAVSGSNDAWLFDDVVLRICWRGDIDRFAREVELSRALPGSALGPTFLDHGRSGDLSWTLARRHRFRTLGKAWFTEPEHILRGHFRELAEILQILHAWQPPEPMRTRLEAAAPPEDAELFAIVGGTLTPQSLDQQLRIVERARQMPYVDQAVLDQAAAQLIEIHGRITLDPADAVFLHGDITPDNVYLDEGRVVGLADYEWARFGPRDAELALPGFWIDAEDPNRPSEDRRRMMTWLLEDYPELGAVPGFEDRRRMFRIAFALRTLLTWPPYGPEPGLDRWHPARQLRALVGTDTDIRV